MDRSSFIGKVYLGDSVYAAYDGAGITLTTENGLPTDPSNTIYIEPEVVRSLLIFMDRYMFRKED